MRCRTFSSALLSAFLSMWRRNSALFLGQRPWVQPNCLALTRRKRDVNNHSCVRRSQSILRRCSDKLVVSSFIQRCPKIVITAAFSSRTHYKHVLEQPLTHLGTPSNTAIVATERDALVFDDNIPQVFVSLANVHAFDGLGCLTGVLVGQNKQAFSATTT